ncbi:Mss4p nuclear export [Paecilomyces lecythidis]|uniref:Protein BCP1 n=1 Tax=Paecilomyces lecythidis TaxID=3004212 RepID=A0ABR3YEM9_9EURO
MGKRKELKDGDVEMGGTNRPHDDDSGSEDDVDMVNVDFEWFDPSEIDFHGLKILLRQLFDTDAQEFDLSALADLILSQPLLGSTVKVDGKESDPYAFLSVLNLQEHKDNPVIKDLITYLQRKASSKPAFAALSSLLSQDPIAPIGLILTERLINIPSEIVPPMYTMLLEEIAWAIEDKEPYNFSHYLIISKTYQEVASKLDMEDSRPKKKKRAGDQEPEVFLFHPEDEVFQRHALCHGGFEYTHPPEEGASDSKRAFQELGIKPAGSLILIEAPKFEAAVKDVSDYLKPPV